MGDSETTYTFPLLVKESVFFVTKCAFIKSAVLSVNDSVLSIIKPVYTPEELQQKTAPDTELKFFGDKPFHGALAAKWDVKIALTVSGKTLPGLVFSQDTTNITWDDVFNETGKYVYYDDVIAVSKAGSVARTLIYGISHGGYRRD